MANTQATLDKIVSLCKRRGFVFPAAIFMVVLMGSMILVTLVI